MFGGSKEDKEAKREEKRREQIEKMLAKYRMSALSDPDDIASVSEIMSDMAGNGLLTLSAATNLHGNPADLATMTYLRAIIEQNFIIIRQLDRLNKKLEK